MINWRSGIAGFKGASKYLIKGFFSYAYSVTSADIILDLKGFGVFSAIDDSGQGLSSAIDASGQGLNSLITPSLGVVSLIDASGQGLTSLINVDGQGVESDI